jgi:hypothetical protein
VHIPWLNEWQYYRDGLPMHQQLIAALAAAYAPAQPFVLTGKGAVELAAMRCADNSALLHVINYTGQRNGRYDTPPELHGLRLGVKGNGGQAKCLVSGQPLAGRAGEGGRTWFDLPPVGAFEAIVVQSA